MIATRPAAWLNRKRAASPAVRVVAQRNCDERAIDLHRTAAPHLPDGAAAHRLHRPSAVVLVSARRRRSLAHTLRADRTPRAANHTAAARWAAKQRRTGA